MTELEFARALISKHRHLTAPRFLPTGQPEIRTLRGFVVSTNEMKGTLTFHHFRSGLTMKFASDPILAMQAAKQPVICLVVDGHSVLDVQSTPHS